MRKRIIGRCHICGKEDELTYEHVPPEKAFNSNKALIYFGKDFLGSDDFPWDLSGKKYKQLQRGIGFNTLCGKCNNDTGGWYADAFVDFTYKGYKNSYNKHLLSNNWITITFPNIYPLKVFKEIIAMFFSVNHEDLSTVHEDPRALVLSKERMGVSSDKYGLYLYFLQGSVARYIGLTGISSFPIGHTRILSELAAPPFGYVLEFRPKDKTGYCDLTFFANLFNFSDKKTITLDVPIYESNTYIPADYRTKKQILDDYIRNKFLELQRTKP
jgi:hypothetical protein